MLINDDKDRPKLVKLHWYSKRYRQNKFPYAKYYGGNFIRKKMNSLSSPLKTEVLKCIPNIVPGNGISSPESVWEFSIEASFYSETL